MLDCSKEEANEVDGKKLVGVGFKQHDFLRKRFWLATHPLPLRYKAPFEKKTLKEVLKEKLKEGAEEVVEVEEVRWRL